MIYKKEALQYINDVPVFCKTNDYVENYDEIAQILIKSLKEEGKNPWMDEEHWKKSEEDTAEICKQYLKPGDRILDVGCGTGRMLSYFSNVKKYGIDISIDMAAMAREKGIEACMGNVEDLPYKDGSMDLVVCTDVLEHVFDLYKTISEINRVVKAGGYIILRVPQDEDLSPYLDPSYPFEYVHLRMFSKSSLELYCTKVFKMKYLQAKNSYGIVEKEYKKFLFFPPIVSKTIMEVGRKINPTLLENERFSDNFLLKTTRYIEIIEAFERCI